MTKAAPWLSSTIPGVSASEKAAAGLMAVPVSFV
jgi:hypothetical protein